MNRWVWLLLALGMVALQPLEAEHRDKLPHRKRGQISSEELTTKLKQRHSCFSWIDHLYFDGATSSFCSWKTSLIPSPIAPVGRRGYAYAGRIDVLPSSISHKLGTTIFVLERDVSPGHSTHYFHFMEHLLGLWNFGGDALRNDVLLFVLASNGIDSPYFWKGVNDVTYHLIRAAFPHAKIVTWNQFLQETQGAFVHLQHALISDRAAEELCFCQDAYERGWMLGRYCRSLHQDKMEHLRAVVLDYCHASKQTQDRFVITYVPRQTRRLDPQSEKELLQKLEALEGVEVRVVDFAQLSFQEQIQAAADTDILVGAHGNGLTHALFLPEGGALIELLPQSHLRSCFHMMASSRKLHYFCWMQGEGWMDEADFFLGDTGDFSYTTFELDVEPIVELIELLIADILP